MGAVVLENIEQIQACSTSNTQLQEIVYAITNRDLCNSDGIDAIFEYINSSATQGELQTIITQVNQAIMTLKANTNSECELMSFEMNSRLTKITNNLVLLNNALEATKIDIANLDNIFSTDAERESLRVALELIDLQLKNTQLDIIATINSNIKILAKRDVIWQKVCNVTSTNGIYELIFSSEIQQVFSSRGEISVSVQVKGTSKAYAFVVDWNKDKAVIQVETKGTHLVPMPKDCSTKNVQIVVTIVHRPKDMFRCVGEEPIIDVEIDTDDSLIGSDSGFVCPREQNLGAGVGESGTRSGGDGAELDGTTSTGA